MIGERLRELELTQAGVLGDRAYALIDADTGKLVSAKSIKRFPDLCDARPSSSKRNGDTPPVRTMLSTGLSVRSDAGDVNRVLSEHFRRWVALARAAPQPRATPGLGSNIHVLARMQ